MSDKLTPADAAELAKWRKQPAAPPRVALASDPPKASAPDLSDPTLTATERAERARWQLGKSGEQRQRAEAGLADGEPLAPPASHITADMVAAVKQKLQDRAEAAGASAPSAMISLLLKVEERIEGIKDWGREGKVTEAEIDRFADEIVNGLLQEQRQDVVGLIRQSFPQLVAAEEAKRQADAKRKAAAPAAVPARVAAANARRVQREVVTALQEAIAEDPADAERLVSELEARAGMGGPAVMFCGNQITRVG